jgi:hypothetical protein
MLSAPMQTGHSVSMTIPAHSSWVPLLQAAAENGARVFGQAREKGLRMAMGMEEVLLHLARVQPGAAVGITLESDAAAMKVTFSLAASALDLSAMNITALPAGGSSHDCEIEDLPLLLASRMSDGFSVSRTGSDIRLTLRQDRHYESIQPVSVACEGPIVPPLQAGLTQDESVIADACARALDCFGTDQLPGWFKTPGRGVDRAVSGEMRISVAADGKNTTCGMLCWEQSSESSVTFSGPWLFTREGDAARILLDHMISHLARTRTVCLFSAMGESPLDLDFDALGFERLDAAPDSDSSRGPLPVWFRHLREGDGLRVWAHPAFVPFLEQIYARLVLPRTIQTVPEIGRQAQDKSLFATSLNKERGEAMLTPLLDGYDNEDNIERHMQMLTREGYRQILFRIDLARGWQAAFGATLLRHGCEPILILPHAGQSDVMVFQYAPGA